VADNITLNAGSGGATLAADDISSVWYQIVKVAFGALDTATLVTTAAPLPVDLRASNASQAVTNAGTFVVQENGTQVQVDDNAFTPATSKIVMAGAEFDDVAPDSVDEGDGGALRMSANRNLYSTIRDAAGNERGANVNASNQLAVTGPVTNAGTFVVQENGGSLTALQLIDDTVFTDDNAFTPATSKGFAVGFQADETAPDSVDEGDFGVPRMTLTRLLRIVDTPHTAGGLTAFYNLDVDETEDAIKASAGQLYELYLLNLTNALLYVKLYNATVANVTVGSTTPVMTIPVPGNNDTDGAGVVRKWAQGLQFDTAMTIAATTGFADNDSGAPAANAVIASGGYV
jgi:hypothetical protein